jgi:hypothetical protein
VQARYDDFGAAKVLMEILDCCVASPLKTRKLDRELFELDMVDDTEISRQKNEL